MRGMQLSAWVALMAAGMLGAAYAQEPNRGGQVDLASRDTKVALERMRPAPGYEVSLFASEQQFPDIAKPLAMTFDTQGRLWVLTSTTYPHYLPGVPPNDKLVVLEDVNRDGRADKATVFADGLYIPTGFELGDGGVYVAQQPNLAFLRDTNGDGRADERKIILHGFGTEDSHHSIHTFTWGPGGGLYFQEGTFLHSQVETPYGPVRLAEAGVWRYEPRTEKLSVFVSYPFANPWGHVVDRWGQNFVSDASNGDNYYGTAFSGHVDYPRKQRAMQKWTLTSVRPTCGIEFVRSRHFPDSAQGNFLMNNVIGFQGIKQYRVQEEGSGFVAVEIEPLLQSSDPNFRPIALQFGPDGALYVGDWFNPLIGHMQYSIRDERRDKAHGRIWRITAKGRPLVDRPRLHGQSISAQLELLKAYEDRTRYQARLALRAQPTDAVVAALRDWTARLDEADPEHEHHLLEALWVYQHHDVVDVALLDRLLKAKEFRARAAATRVLHHWFSRVDGAMGRMKTLVSDPAPRVRLEAVRALSFVPTAEAAELALNVLRHPMDYYLQYALDSTMTTLENAWKRTLTSSRPFSEGNPAGLEFVLARLDAAELSSLPRTLPVYRALVERPGIDPKTRRDALEGLARLNATRPIDELLSAIARLDGQPGSGRTVEDLARMLIASDQGTLAAARKDLERLALGGLNAAARQGALVALMRADGSAERTWQLTESNVGRRIDLLRAVSGVEDARLLDELYAKVAAVVGGASAASTPPVVGRYVRVVFPGRERSLRLAEVQVYSGGTNVVSSGAASQSSIVAGGGVGGHAARAIDGRTDTDQKAESVAFTNVERDPWWELDLKQERPIDTIVLWTAVTSEKPEGMHLSVLDGSRRPVFADDGLTTGRRSERLVLGGDVTPLLRSAAAAALASTSGRDAERVALLAPLVSDSEVRHAAIDALRRIPRDRWPAAEVERVAQSIIAYARDVEKAERTSTAFKTAVAFGRELAAQLQASEGEQVLSTLDQLVVRTIRIQAVPAAMKFDLARIVVEPGEELEIEFFNPDEMPHNLLITAPGALEAVSLKAEAMAKEPDAFAKNFVPDTPEVLAATRLINRGETARLRFTAPARTGAYPFVCTFPGHWRTMNGIMQVSRATSQ
jgi:azurin